LEAATIHGSQLYRRVAPLSSEISIPKFAPTRMRDGALGWKWMLNSSGNAPFELALAGDSKKAS
jgi:hypothetical protein